MKKKLFSIVMALCLLLGCVPVLATPAAAAGSEPAGPSYSLPFGTTISAGAAHMAVIKEDGTLWVWGRNTDNRLGIGATEKPVTAPIQVPLDKKVVSVSAGSDTTAVITADGELWNWGSDNWHGNLGRETEGDNLDPGKVMDHVYSVSSHGYHTAAITQDGTLWVWGRNSSSQLGNNRQGTIVQGKFRSFSYEPLPTRAMENVRSVETGVTNTFAILSDGTLWGWGDNKNGVLGNDTSVWKKGEHDDSLLGVTDRWSETYDKDYTVTTVLGSSITYGAGTTRERSSTYQPVPVRIMEDVAKVSTGTNGTVILKTDGSVWTCTGARELPDGRYTYAPEQVFDGAIDVATTGESFAALREDGSLWTWGSRAFGLLGRETQTDAEGKTPGKVMDDVAAITAGPSCMAALKNDGSLWMWGDNSNSALGVKTENYYTATPTRVIDGIALPSRRTKLLTAYDETGTTSAETALAKDALTENTLAGADAVYQFQLSDTALLSDGTANPETSLMPGSAKTNERAARKSNSSKSSGSKMKIPADAFYINGNAFYGYPASYARTWSKAKAYCESVGGHLATLATPQEESLYFAEGPMFIGGRRKKSSGQWYWITGEPSNFGISDDPTNNCLVTQSDGWWCVPNNYKNVIGFICEWETGGYQSGAYQVRFNANGGTVDTASKQVTNGQIYGALPVPVRAGYRFLGWFNSNNIRIFADSTVDLTENQTLYAGWREHTGVPSIEDVSYSFANSPWDFGYEKTGHWISRDIFTYMFGNNRQALEAYQQEGEWGGSCFGMAASATMLYMNNDTTPRSRLTLDDSWVNLDSRGSSCTIRELIDMIHIIQCSSFYQYSRYQNDNKYTRLVNAVMDFEDTGAEPVFISFWGPVNNKGGRPGHAVLALCVRRDQANKRDIIQIYDPNFPLDGNRWIDLYWSTPGNYTGWHYYTNDSEHWGSDSGGTITFATYTDMMLVWNNRGTENALSANALYANTLAVNCANASIYDYAGNLAATIRDGVVNSNREDIFPVGDITDTGTVRESEAEVRLWLPQEYFVIVNEDPDTDELSVRLSGETSSLSVSTSSDRALLYTNEEDGANVALVNGDEERYEMIFTSEKNGEIRLTGTTKEETPACFAQIDGKLSGMGVKVGKNSQLSINGKTGSADDIAQTTLVSLITSTEPSVITSVFADISGDSYYAPAVQWAYDAGIVSAASTGIFDPDHACTRGEAITLLWQAMGCPAPAPASTEQTFSDISSYARRKAMTLLWQAMGYSAPANTEQTFSDVKESDDFYQAVQWAAATGVTADIGGNKFAPKRICSDKEFLTFLWYALDKPGQRTELTGYDDAMAWAREQGLLEDSDTLPSCLRRDAVTFLYRALP